MAYVSGVVFSGFAGWLAGMLINYLADVLPGKRGLVLPFCHQCGQRMPVLNYLLFPRRCGSCHVRRPFRTVLVEILFLMAGVWSWLYTPERLGFGLGLTLLAYLGLVTVIDLEHRLILHPVSLVGVVLGGAVGVRLHGLQATLLGGLAGFAAMLILYFLGIALMGWVTRRRGQTLEEEPLGFGDVNFGGVLGLLLGWPGIVIGIMLTILLAGGGSLIYMLIMLVARRYRSDLAIAYGPFMVLSAILLLFAR
jgi:prepilin signal peptidase PulO-like enzyme (type II secretory pathway)